MSRGVCANPKPYPGYTTLPTPYVRFVGMSKRARTEGGGISFPRSSRANDKSILNVIMSANTTVVTRTLFTADDSGTTVDRIIVTGHVTKQADVSGTHNLCIVIVRKHSGLALATFSAADGAQSYGNDQDVLWQGLYNLSSTAANSGTDGGHTGINMEINIDVKGKRKLANADSIVIGVISDVTVATVAFVGACTVFAKMP